MKNKQILIIGGNGFIGRNLADYLINCGEEVFSFDIRNPEIENPKVKYIIGNFFDDNDLKKALNNMDVVIHALSTLNPGNSNQEYLRGYTNDFLQSVKLFDLINEQNSKLIFLSSGGTVYGDQDVQPIKENVLPLPINHYGCLKLCIENVIRTFNIQKKANMKIARISNPYGPGQDYHKGVGFVDAAIKKTLNNEVIEIWGDGNIIRDYIYVKDVCKMIYAILNYDGNEDTFNVSSNEGISQNDVINELRKIGYNPQVNYMDKRSVDVSKIVLNNEKIKEIIEDEIIKFSDGISMYIDYLKDLNEE